MACDDSTSTIGSSLTGANVAIVIDSAYTLSGRTIPTGPIDPKTAQMLIGAINVPEYGTFRSNVVTQFLPATDLDTSTFTIDHLDEVYLTLQYSRGAFMGDSVTPMGITVYELDRQLPDNIGSDFDPTGYYKTTPLGTTTYNTAIFEDDSLRLHATRNVNIALPLEFGRRLFKAYIDNPADFANGQIFSEKVMPGFYIESSYGSGRVTLFSKTGINMHFFKEFHDEELDADTTFATTYTYMLVTPEVISNNDLDISLSDDLKRRYQEGKKLLVAPAGYEVEVEFPLTEIISSYRADSKSLTIVNGLTMTIPIDTIENSSKVTPPPYALMVLKKDKDEFFAKNKLPDNKTSFYAEYNSATKQYAFSSMTPYLQEMLAKEEEITADDYTFVIIPAQLTFESTTSSYYYQ
ncbi:MAG: DUF4270 domain-containing protein, partial [Muribaculaceae bacterium]|nr:DUF4270 domain-containing protein [Muribaculaceae bacterium]